jgi:hypothetical protein
MIKALHITSTIRPAGGGQLPQRISLHRSEGAMPIATHHEALKEDGNWCRFGGNYFTGQDMPAALADYEKRCRAIGVYPYEEDPS